MADNLANDPFAEWPPAHYHTMTEQEIVDAEMAIDDSPVGIGSAGILRNGHPPTWPGYIDNRQRGI